jgi:hypothetical protein
MAKPMKKTEEQNDLFPEEPVVGALAITDFKVNGAEVKATLVGVTNVNDVARLNTVCWQQAVAQWLITLHQGDIDQAMVDVKKAYVHFVNLNGEPHRPTPDSGSRPGTVDITVVR